MSDVKKSIELRRWSSGDWDQLIVDNKLVYENHSIPYYIWLDILQDCGFNVSETEFDEDGDGTNE